MLGSVGGGAREVVGAEVVGAEVVGMVMGDVVAMGKGAVGVEVCASLGSGSVAAYRERRRKFKHMCLRIISIHAPRAGSDCEFRRCIPQYGMTRTCRIHSSLWFSQLQSQSHIRHTRMQHCNSLPLFCYQATASVLQHW